MKQVYGGIEFARVSKIVQFSAYKVGSNLISTVHVCSASTDTLFLNVKIIDRSDSTSLTGLLYTIVDPVKFLQDLLSLPSRLPNTAKARLNLLRAS